MIVFHHNDADGRCSAAIVRRWLVMQSRKPKGDTSIRFVEMDYKMACPVDQIKKDETVVIVDFSFPPLVMGQIQAATDIGVIWCDHHATAKDYNYKLAGERDFTDKGRAGCECTWDYLFPHDPIPRAVVLLGDYDAWRMYCAPECLEFYEGLKMEDTSPESTLWKDLFDGRLVGDVVEKGRMAIQYRDIYCREMRKAFGYETEIDGIKAYACNISRFGSPGFGEMLKKYPICISYAHDGERFTVNLYSETVDVGAIAKNHKGGGHKGAAGFICGPGLPFKRSAT